MSRPFQAHAPCTCREGRDGQTKNKNDPQTSSNGGRDRTPQTINNRGRTSSIPDGSLGAKPKGGTGRVGRETQRKPRSPKPGWTFYAWRRGCRHRCWRGCWRRRRTQAPLASVLKCWFLSLVPVRVPKSGAQGADSGVGI